MHLRQRARGERERVRKQKGARRQNTDNFLFSPHAALALAAPRDTETHLLADGLRPRLLPPHRVHQSQQLQRELVLAKVVALLFRFRARLGGWG